MVNSSMKYSENSFARGLNPLIKFGFFLIAIVAAFLPIGLTGYVLITSLGVIAFVIAKGRLSAAKSILIPTILMFLIIMTINWFVVAPEDGQVWEVMFYLGEHAVYSKSMHITTTVVVRMFNILLFGSIYTQTTSNRDIARVFGVILWPFKLIFIPVDKLAMIMSLALRFVPELLFNFNEIIKAQKSRGVDISSPNLREKSTAIKNAFTPMFVLMFKKSETISSSMEMRGFENKKKTNYLRWTFNWKDLLATLVLFGFISLIVLLSLDEGGEWIPRFADMNWWRPDIW